MHPRQARILFHAYMHASLTSAYSFSRVHTCIHCARVFFTLTYMHMYCFAAYMHARVFFSRITTASVYYFSRKQTKFRYSIKRKSNIASLVRTENCCLEPSTFENFTVLVRPYHAKNSSPAQFGSSPLEIRVLSPESDQKSTEEHAKKLCPKPGLSGHF
jgi:hypothetical protein